MKRRCKRVTRWHPKGWFVPGCRLHTTGCTQTILTNQEWTLMQLKMQPKNYRSIWPGVHTGLVWPLCIWSGVLTYLVRSGYGLGYLHIWSGDPCAYSLGYLQVWLADTCGSGQRTLVDLVRGHIWIWSGDTCRSSLGTPVKLVGDSCGSGLGRRLRPTRCPSWLSVSVSRCAPPDPVYLS